MRKFYPKRRIRVMLIGERSKEIVSEQEQVSVGEEPQSTESSAQETEPEQTSAEESSDNSEDAKALSE
jgi:hypothetical protein